MELLTNLGVNSSIWVHLGIFLFCFAFCAGVLFVPYLNQYLQRVEQTEGNEEAAEKINQVANELLIQFEEMSKALNSQIRFYFDQAFEQGSQQQLKILETARSQANEFVSLNRAKISKEMEKARRDLKASVPVLSQDIEAKLLN